MVQIGADGEPARASSSTTRPALSATISAPLVTEDLAERGPNARSRKSRVVCSCTPAPGSKPFATLSTSAEAPSKNECLRHGRNLYKISAGVAARTFAGISAIRHKCISAPAFRRAHASSSTCRRRAPNSSSCRCRGAAGIFPADRWQCQRAAASAGSCGARARGWAFNSASAARRRRAAPIKRLGRRRSAVERQRSLSARRRNSCP